MAWHMLQYLLYLITAALLGLLVGWLIWSRRSVRDADDLDRRARELRTELARLRQQNSDCAAESTRLRRLVDQHESAARSATPSAGAAAATRTNNHVDAGTGTVAPGSDAESLRPLGLVGVVGGQRGTDEETVADGDASADAEPDGEDDLTRIEGIGPKMAGALNAAGIGTFRRLADSTEEARRAALAAADLRFAPSMGTWARQAKYLVDGDEGGFTAYTGRLTAGRDDREA